MAHQQRGRAPWCEQGVDRRQQRSSSTPPYLGPDPFLPPTEVRFDSRLNISDGVRDFVSCMHHGAQMDTVGFQNPNPAECFRRFRDVVWARAFSDDEAKANILERRRCTVDPYCLPWSPRSSYMWKLEGEGRLPEQQFNHRMSPMEREQEVEEAKEVLGKLFAEINEVDDKVVHLPDFVLRSVSCMDEIPIGSRAENTRTTRVEVPSFAAHDVAEDGDEWEKQEKGSFLNQRFAPWNWGTK